MRAYLDGVIADNFAGGGGASLGIELALGRSPDVAVNHDAEAIAMHAANHPATKHYIESVYKVDPREACGGRSCALLWLSPDCKHHSKAKGGEPRDQRIRGLAWIGVTWAARVKPSVICLENVEEFQKWGPLHRQHTDGCTGASGRCRKSCRLNKPIREREGETFRAFVGRLQRLGYEVEWKLLRACDYGAPTTRRRLFLVARRDGRPIRWPAPTHGKPGSGLLPYRTAAECIDWSIPCPSIFGRKKPLADKTLARIARGIKKFVLESGRPFIVPVNHGSAGGTRTDERVHSIDDPLRTVTGGCRGSHALASPVLVRVAHGESNVDANGKVKKRGSGAHDINAPLGVVTASGGDHAIAIPYMVHLSNGERPGQEPRIYDINEPVRTVVAQGVKQGLVEALVAPTAQVAAILKHYGGNESTKGGTSPDAPLDTITTQDHHAVMTVGVAPADFVASHLVKLRGTSEAHLDASASGMDEQVPTISAQGNHLAAVHAFLVRFNGAAKDGQAVNEALGTVTSKPRFGLVTVTINGEQYAIVDIGMRMLEPRELARAQGFPDTYTLNPVGPSGKPLTKTSQIRMIGNSVSPNVGAAVVAAQFATDEDDALAAAA